MIRAQTRDEDDKKNHERFIITAMCEAKLKRKKERKLDHKTNTDDLTMLPRNILSLAVKYTQRSTKTNEYDSTKKKGERMPRKTRKMAKALQRRNEDTDEGLSVAKKT
jgi:hypothetical protein